MAILTLGSSGAEVTTVQQALAGKGFLAGPPDGHFGPETAAAVLAFQKSEGLAADGTVGPLTYAALLGSPTPQGTLPGLDLSHFQGAVDWKSVASAGMAFAFLKATDGITYTDPTYPANLAGARGAGLPCGAYHFFRPLDDANRQADYFCSQAGFQAGDLPPVLDIEETKSDEHPQEDWSILPAAQRVNNIQQWLNRIEGNLKVRPVIYVATSFVEGFLAGSTQFQGYPLWVARYANQVGTLPPGWNDWTFWQYSPNGQVPGVSGQVDLDYFNGAAADLRKLGGG
jgi:lysozyme